MKIRLRGSIRPDTGAELMTRGAERLVGYVRMGLFFESSWPDEGLGEFLATFRDVPGIDFNVWMEFTKKDIATARYLLARPTKLVKDSDADFQRTRAYIDALPWRGDDPETKFRLIDRVYLSRFRLRPNQVAAVGQWSVELVAHDAAYAALKDCGLTGLDQRPVMDTVSGLQCQGYVMLYTESVLSGRIHDLTSPRFITSNPEERGFERLGCLCYEQDALATASDFNRTAENMVGFEFPEWVVSRRVADCFRERGLKGLRFEPVLEDLTRPYDEYLSLWGSLYDAMSAGRYTIRTMRPWI